MPFHFGVGRGPALVHLSWARRALRLERHDIDDNIINRALREDDGVPSRGHLRRKVWEAMAAIGVARPNDVPHATQYVPEMVALIESLLANDIAYVISDGVYFDTSRVPITAAGGQPWIHCARARIESSDEKRSPLDFVLWKYAKAGDPVWSALRRRTPGWHTECVVMSLTSWVTALTCTAAAST